MNANPKTQPITRASSRSASAEQRLKRTAHRAPGAPRAIWNLRGSGADGQSAFSDRDAFHGRPCGKIPWARRRGTHCCR